ncbi:TonB-dependent receptor domain-containing protein [Sphingomicrobium lutaoense]|uniref:TonB-dependent receptor n=1 Tax=Sphingomicrobium lutaoense TaxID=515949 RepID=A0A839Z0U8_9SPHN|nr:TonB-dependent receptor [Sphingomicrobium lutaoense]MBB3764886.1 hypothetical protein [Sphingomicrobium lutaoense]
MFPRTVLALLAGTALAAPLAAQQAEPSQDPTQAGDQEVIIVEAQRPRGSALGDIDPEYVLDPRDIAATGANNIEELLDALAPEIGSVRGRGGGGGRPVLLVNGKRISGFRELRNLPPEAIERMDILPEETALLYGYKADQRVVNFVLRENFHSTTLGLEGQWATDGGREGGELDLDRLMLKGGARTNISLDVEGDALLRESERGIALQPVQLADTSLDPRSSRSLLPERRMVRLDFSHARPIGNLNGSASLEVEQSENDSLLGPSFAALTLPADSPYARQPEDEDILLASGLPALGRDSRTRSANLAAVLNGPPAEWGWSTTLSAALADRRTLTDRGADVAAFQDRLDALDPAADPFASPGFNALAVEEATSLTRSLAADGVLNGTLGAATLTLRANSSWMAIESEGFRDGQPLATDLSRRRNAAAFSADAPVFDNLGLNANGEVEHVSDFGTLTSIGAGFNWKPTRKLDLIGSWTREEGAPGLGQLGDPRIASPATRFFDFVTGESLLVTAISGGNPDLLADRRNVWKLAAGWRLPTRTDLNLRTEYVRERIDDPAASFPAASAAIEAAFPDRFVRDGDGTLLLVDLTPVNFDDQRRDTLRTSLNWSKSSGGPRGPRRGPPGRGRGGRIYAALFHTLTLTDDVRIAPGLPRLDYLGGEAKGGTGGQPRHEIEARAGIFKNGFGLRLSGAWRSATRVDSGDSSLRFDDFATIDLRAFVNFSDRQGLIEKAPWLRGTSLRLSVDNLFNARPDVRDAQGLVPTRYQPALIEPLGRTVGIAIRKIFVPSRYTRPSGPPQRGRGQRGD